MALSAPLLARKRILRIATESTKGTAVTTTDYLLVFDLQTNVESTFAERKGGGGFLGHTAPGIVDGILAGSCSFTAELKGTDSAALNTVLVKLLKACGVAQATQVYTPTSVPGTMETVTVDVFEDGVQKRLRGAMGNAVFRNGAGGRVLIDFTLTGVWQPPVDTALPTPTFTAVVPMRTNAAAGAFTIDSETIKVANWSFDLGNNVILRPDIANQGGSIHALITGRDPAWTLDPEFDKVAGYDFYGKWLAGTTANLSLSITNGTDTATFASTKLQFRDPSQADRDGIQTLDVTAQCVATSGDDEWSLTLT
tara:strand:+ start:7858 stop:8787 length:930 start_codon:yes stop_codon:yes gene_type:complete